MKAIDFNASQQDRDELMHKVKRAYQALFDLHLDGPPDDLHPRELPLAADAQSVFNAAYMRCEEKVRLAKGVMAEWMGKGAGRILRLALTFEMMAWALEPTAFEPTEISADSVNRAVDLFQISGGDVRLHHGRTRTR